MVSEFSTREVPWMKAGVALIDQPVTAAEAAELGGLDFDIELWPLQAVQYAPVEEEGGGRGIAVRQVDVSDRFAAVRTDTQEALSVVGSHYEVLNFAKAFDFMDTINPTYVAAGVRRGGREGYMVVKAPEHLSVDLVDGEDPHDLYMVLRSSHDGSKKVEVSVLPLRGKCTNMLSLRGFSHGAQRSWGIRHTATMHEKLEEARESLENLDDYVKDLQDTSRTLAEIDIELEDAKRMLEWVLPDKPKRDENVSRILEIYKRDETNGYAGNAWGLVNGLSEWLDWGRGSTSMDARFIGGLAGYGHNTLNRLTARLMSGDF